VREWKRNEFRCCLAHSSSRHTADLCVCCYLLVCQWWWAAAKARSNTPLLLLAQFCLCKSCGSIDYSKQTKHSSSTSNQQQPQECTYKCMYVCGYNEATRERKPTEPEIRFQHARPVFHPVRLSVSLFSTTPMQRSFGSFRPNLANKPAYCC
jgi:hypothetical protein